MSTDGSLAPEPPCAKGLSGAAATLWHFDLVSSAWCPVFSLAASSTWAAAIASEATALQLAFCILQHHTHVCLHDVFAVEGLDWILLSTVLAAIASAETVGADAFLRFLHSTDTEASVL